ncbi:MAG TPA: flagellar hook-associated protein FlgK [Bacillota bacterium]
MRSTFFAVEIARRALWANQRAMDVTAHNVANANTPGYARQVAELQATPPQPLGTPGAITAGQVGTGVTVGRIESLRDRFLDQQVWTARSDLESWALRRQVYEQIEVILQEPSDAGIRGALDRWWDAFSVLANDPESSASRNLVLERSQALVATFQTIDRQLAAMEDELADALSSRVRAVNDLAERIAALNQRIAGIESSGQRANDLRDERARLIEELSKHVDVKVRETERGHLRVTVGGVDLVGEAGARSLTLTDKFQLQWSSDGTEVELRAGAIFETLNQLRQILPGYRDDLREMAQTLSEAVNNIHAAGYGLDGTTGEPFFVIPDGGLTSLDEWAVNPALLRNPAAIAAAKPLGDGAGTGDSEPSDPFAPGDGSNAAEIAALRHQLLFNNTATFDDHYRSWIGAIGAASQQAQQMEQNQQLLLGQIEQQRQQVAGVSLDEELSNMMLYRQAYNAAARILTVADEMLSTLVSATGIVGR